MKVCLYIAEHNKTGLKYFGKTSRYFSEKELQKNYHGSGTYWLDHLRKHGDDVTMKVFGVFEENEVEKIAKEFSESNDIVNSKEWANLIIENGLDGGIKGSEISREQKEILSKIHRNTVGVFDIHTGEKFKVSREIWEANDNLVAISKGKKRSKRRCTFCDKEVYPSEEMYHFDFCKNNPDRKIRIFNCEFCGKEINDPTGLKNHKLLCKQNPNKKKVSCQFCGKEYGDDRNKIRHEKTCVLNPDKKEYFCSYCGKQMKNNSAKIKHENICDSNPKKKEVIYNCQYCGKEYKKTKINLIKHEKYYCSENPNREDLKFTCSCGKIYKDVGNFSKHTKKCKRKNDEK